MPQRADLKKRLRAADRRRKQRSTGDSNISLTTSTATTVATKTDTVELIGRVILNFAEENPQVNDAIALTALRSCQVASTPHGDDAKLLFNRINQIAGRTDVDERAFIMAIRKVVMLATEHQDRKHPKAFLTYLMLLGS